MHETTGFTRFKTEKEDKWVRHWHYYTIANSNLLQIRGQDTPGFWNFQQKKVVFLVSSGKNQI